MQRYCFIRNSILPIRPVNRIKTVILESLRPSTPDGADSRTLEAPVSVTDK